jgi:hypothetical protein
MDPDDGVTINLDLVEEELTRHPSNQRKRVNDWVNWYFSQVVTLDEDEEE